MPPLSEHHSTQTTKLLFIGDSGSGKTGALASLADAGYNLRVLDLDNGLDVLTNLLRDPGSRYKREALERVTFVTLTDSMKKTASGQLVPHKARVWQNAMDMLTHWREPAGKGEDGKPTWTGDLGPITSWTPQDVLVVDSLTMLSTAALNFILSMNARLGSGRVEQGDWYQGQQLIEGMLQMLYDEAVRCNVIVISHIKFIGEENGPQHGYPSTLGQALPPKVGRYFNSILLARSTGSGSNRTRKIFTSPQGLVELKNTAPLRVKESYGIETGLAEYFRDVRGAKP